MSHSLLHVLAPARVGGLEAVVRRLSLGQHERTNLDVRVGAIVEPENRPHPFVEELKKLAVPVTSLTVSHRAYFTEINSIRRLIHRFSPDLLHTHGYRADVVAGTFARLSGACPVVATVHGFIGGGLKNKLYEFLQRQSLVRYDAVISVSKSMSGRLEAAGVPEDRLHVIPNAWSPTSSLAARDEARDRLQLPSDAPIVGWVGRLSPEKGGDVFLRALALLNDTVVATVLGEGPERKRLSGLAETLNISERVQFRGLVPRAAELYRAFDVFCLSSRTEGIPISILEAMDAEIPVVATTVGGVPEVVTNEHAFLVPPEAPEEMASALQTALVDRKESRKRAHAAKQRLRDHFSLDAWLDRYAEVYRRVLARAEATA